MLIWAAPTTLGYDAENRLVSVSGALGASFVNNADGRRVKSTVAGVTTAFIGDYYEWRGSAAASVKYYYAGGVRVAMRTGGGEPKHLLGDHLGSTSVLVNGDGTGGQAQGYMPWGETRYGWVGTEYQYTGQYRLAALGLDYYGARWYDPYINRWASPDSIIPDPNNPLDYDRYSYVRNNPVHYIDPTGHMVDSGCQSEGCSSTSGTGYRDYIYNIIHNGSERNRNTQIIETAEEVVEFTLSIVYEPADWVFTIGDCINGECSAWALLGLIPLIPGNKVDELWAALKKLEGTKMPIDDVLDLASEFLGDSYKYMGNGRFVSANGTRQIRMGDTDILGKHGPPHINFEFLGPNPAKPGAMTQIYPTIHIYFSGR